MSDTKISEAAPNWCRTCGRRPNDPMAALCLDTHHRTLERLHPQPAELAEQQGEREQFEEWALSEGLSIERNKLDDEYLFGETHEAWRVWQAACQAAATGKQQVGEVQELDFYREHIGNDLDNLLIGAGAMQITHEGGYEACWKNTMEAVERLAARQPGAQEPEVEFQCRLMDVKTDLPTENWHHSPTFEENPGRGTHYWVQYRKRYIYYAPPAQGIDLGQFRELAEFVEEFALGVGCAPESSRLHEQSKRLLSLIDGRDAGTGVGNG